MKNNGLVSSILAVNNLNRAKYGAATIATEVIRRLNLNIDWDFAIDIFCDTDEFLNYKTEAEYIYAVLVKYLEVLNDYVINPAVFEPLYEKAKSSYYYIVNEKEIELLKTIWKKFITGFVDAYKVNNMEPIIRVEVKDIASLYDYNDEFSCCAHFVRTVYEFFNYHLITCRQIRFTKELGDLFIIDFYA